MQTQLELLASGASPSSRLISSPLAGSRVLLPLGGSPPSVRLARSQPRERRVNEEEIFLQELNVHVESLNHRNEELEASLEQYRRELASALQEKEQLSKKLGELHANQTLVSERFRSLEVEREHDQKTIAKLEVLLARTRESHELSEREHRKVLDDYKAKYDRTKDQMDEALSREKGRASALLFQTQEQLAAHQAHLASSKAEVDRLSTELQEKCKLLADAQKELENARKSILELSDSSRAERDQHSKTVSRLKAELQDTKRTLELAEVERRKLTDQLKSQSEDLRKRAHKNQTLERDSARHMEELRAMQDKENCHQRKMDVLLRGLQEILNRLPQGDAIVSPLSDTNELQSLSFSNPLLIIRTISTAVEGLCSSVQQLSAKTNRMKAENLDSEKQITSLKQRCAQLEDESRQRGEAHQAALQFAEVEMHLKAQLTEAREKCENLHAEVERQVSARTEAKLNDDRRINQLQFALDELKCSAASSDQQLATLSQRYDDSVRKCAALEQCNASLERMIAALRAELLESAKEVEANVADLAECRMGLTKAVDQKNRLHSRMMNCSEELRKTQQLLELKATELHSAGQRIKELEAARTRPRSQQERPSEASTVQQKLLRMQPQPSNQNFVVISSLLQWFFPSCFALLNAEQTEIAKLPESWDTLASVIDERSRYLLNTLKERFRSWTSAEAEVVRLSRLVERDRRRSDSNSPRLNGSPSSRPTVGHLTSKSLSPTPVTFDFTPKPDVIRGRSASAGPDPAIPHLNRLH